MAYTIIDDSAQYFNTVLYTGNGTTDHAITGVGFRPDFFWGKKRSASGSHFLVNSISGIGKHLHSDESLAETTFAEGVKSFDSDGVTIGTAGDINDNSQTFVAWNWLAGGSASSNSDGSITSSVSASTTAGFSIVSYTGTGSAATVGHGLSTVPKMIIAKNRDATQNWGVYHVGIGNTKHLRLNSTNASSDSNNLWNNTTPTSSVFSVAGQDMVNKSGDDSIAYCFAEKKGYSKFGSYTGNGNADGTFVYTGFKPAWVMAKRTGTSGQNWEIHDNKRPEYNSSSKRLWANLSNAEATEDPYLDLVSNGFKIKTSDTNYNASDSYIYMAFAESPFVNSNGIPTNAR